MERRLSIKAFLELRIEIWQALIPSDLSHPPTVGLSFDIRAIGDIKQET
jgi:hypothetical protein